VPIDSGSSRRSAVDCGVCINPAGVRAQIESGIARLTAANTAS
jgi:hypothetical protein